MSKVKISKARKALAKKKPEKNLTVFLKRTAGRAKSGRITVRHRGGGAKRLYRRVEFGQKRLGEKATVKAIEYDPYRTCFIALIEYEDGERAYILAPDRLQDGDIVETAEKAAVQLGNRMQLANIPAGSTVYNIELIPGRGGQLARSAGTAAKVLAHEGKYAHIEMPSGEVRKVLQTCYASIGEPSNPEHRYEQVGKAGRSRLRGRRPVVRGSAMNPVDHPHGGGEGRASIGLKYPKTPWGKPALGVRTRRRKNTSKFILKRRQKKRR